METRLRMPGNKNAAAAPTVLRRIRWRLGWRGGKTAIAPWLCAAVFQRLCSEQRAHCESSHATCHILHQLRVCSVLLVLLRGRADAAPCHVCNQNLIRWWTDSGMTYDASLQRAVGRRPASCQRSVWLWRVERGCGLHLSAIAKKNRGTAHWQRGNAVRILYELVIPKLSG